MNDPISITVPVDIARTSPNALTRLMWQERGRRKKTAKEAARVVWVCAGRPRVDCPVIVDIVIRRGRKLDADNALAACKPAIDGLFKDGLVPDDGPRWLTIGEVRQESGKEWKGRECVEFLVRPAE